MTLSLLKTQHLQLLQLLFKCPGLPLTQYPVHTLDKCSSFSMSHTKYYPNCGSDQLNVLIPDLSRRLSLIVFISQCLGSFFKKNFLPFFQHPPASWHCSGRKVEGLDFWWYTKINYDYFEKLSKWIAACLDELMGWCSHYISYRERKITPFQYGSWS